MALEIRLLNISEFKLANDFYNTTRQLNRSSPASPRSYADFSWEFINCPYGEAIYAGAFEKENGYALVGMQCFIPMKMIDNKGSEILTAKGEATLIDPKAMIKYKKTDILKELFDLLMEECRQRGFQFIWGFNNIPATYKRLGCENPFKSSHGLLVLKPWEAYKNILSQKKEISSPLKLKLVLGTWYSYIRSLKKIIPLSQRNAFTFSIKMGGNRELFQNSSCNEKLIFLLQDKAYLDWRISKNPYRKQSRSFEWCDEKQVTVAQIICSIKDKVAFIEQTLFDNKINPKQRKLFLSSALRFLEKEDVCLVRYTGFSNTELNLSEIALFKALGFIFTGKGDWFTFKKLSTHGDIDPKNIYLSNIYKQGTD